MKAPPTQAGTAGIPLLFVTWPGEGVETQGHLGLLLLTAGSFWKRQRPKWQLLTVSHTPESSADALNCHPTPQLPSPPLLRCCPCWDTCPPCFLCLELCAPASTLPVGSTLDETGQVGLSRPSPFACWLLEGRGGSRPSVEAPASALISPGPMDRAPTPSGVRSQGSDRQLDQPGGTMSSGGCGASGKYVSHLSLSRVPSSGRHSPQAVMPLAGRPLACIPRSCEFDPGVPRTSWVPLCPATEPPPQCFVLKGKPGEQSVPFILLASTLTQTRLGWKAPRPAHMSQVGSSR